MKGLNFGVVRRAPHELSSMKRPDARVRAAMLTVALIMLGGVAIIVVPREAPPAGPHDAVSRPHAAQVDERFSQGVLMLHAKRFEYAFAAFHQVLKYAPDMPEAHVNMGFALLGLKRFAEARDFFHSAIELRPRQLNAYYGLAEAHEGEGDLRGAIGAMRTYVHLADKSDRHRRKGEAALWEWEATIAKSGKAIPTIGSEAAPSAAKGSAEHGKPRP